LAETSRGKWPKRLGADFCTGADLVWGRNVLFASTFWSPYTGTLIDQIESVQRRAARWVKHDFGCMSSVTDMLTSLQWRRIDLRRIDQHLVMFHNILHDQVAIPFPKYIIPLTRSSGTSHLHVFQQVPTKTDYYKYSFFPKNNNE
jgi:hypothetical protein